MFHALFKLELMIQIQRFFLQYFSLYYTHKTPSFSLMFPFSIHKRFNRSSKQWGNSLGRIGTHFLCGVAATFHPAVDIQNGGVAMVLQDTAVVEMVIGTTLPVGLADFAKRDVFIASMTNMEFFE